MTGSPTRLWWEIQNDLSVKAARDQRRIDAREHSEQ